jgi:glycosyltransferase involved in cell wall biosynthesis
MTFEEILDTEAKRLLNDKNLLENVQAESINRKIFTITSYLANRLIYIYTDRLTKMSSSIGIVNLVHSLSTIGLVHLFVTPYYVAFHQQHRSKSLMKELEDRFLPVDRSEKRQRIALFTDTLHEINGVAITIKRLIETAKKQGVELVVITSSQEETSFKNGVMNFKAISDFALPEYPEIRMHFPPVLDVIDYFEREGFTKIHVSTPGSLGLIALFIAKLMDMPISGTYHTDIPQYVKSHTNDSFFENAAWNYMIWFYNQMKEVTVPSASTRKQLVQKGLPAEKIKPLPRWVDTEIFSPVKRNPHSWQKYGLNSEMKFLYVGRVSKEKNLQLLADAFIDITDAGYRSALIVVGDGAFRNELEHLLNGYPVLFTGFLSGDELSTIYASSDVFVFPSTTDTFGNVVLEAQSSGLPVIVSDEGGPKELMVDGKTGLVIKAHSKTALVDALTFFFRDKNNRAFMGSNARNFAETNGITAYEAYRTILNTHAKIGERRVTEDFVQV